MKILALDTATHTGWAVLANGVITSGVEDFSIRTQATKSKSADFAGLRFRRFRDWLITKIHDDKPDIIVYEAIVGGMHAGGKTSLIQKGFEAIILEAATHFEGWSQSHRSVWSFSPSTIKKWATGSGVLTHESKTKLVRMAVKKWTSEGLLPHRPTKSQPWSFDDNQCDAMWLADLAHHVVAPAFNKMGLLAHEADPKELTAFANFVTNIKWPSNAKKRSKMK